MDKPTIEDAIELAVHVHRGHTDKAGVPYFLHPLRVMLSMETTTEMQAAVLHDVIEDGEITPEILSSKGYSDDVCLAVKAVTKIMINTE